MPQEDIIQSFLLKVPPEPPFFKPDLCPVDPPGWTPSARIRSAEGRPSLWINGTIRCGTSRAVRKQSYRMDAERNRLAPPVDLNSEIMG
jgi:hypothetical protein